MDGLCMWEQSQACLSYAALQRKNTESILCHAKGYKVNGTSIFGYED